MNLNSRRSIIFASVALAISFIAAGTAFAAIDKVIAVPWQGDVSKPHTVISGSSSGITPIPDSITFEILNTQCSYGGSWEFFLNGTSLGTVSADPVNSCSCAPGLQTVVYNNAALVASGAWQTTSDNVLRAKLTGTPYYSWVRALIVSGASSSNICLGDFNGGDCTVSDLCSAGYANGPIDYSNSTSTEDAAVLAQLKGVVKTSGTDTYYYQWVFGDGTSSTPASISGSTKYNLEASHTYVAAPGTPFTAKLLVANDSSMAGAVEDPYLVKVEADSLDARINIAIDKGLWWLYKQGNVLPGYESWPHTYNGQPFMAWLQASWEGTLASPSASAIQAFAINNHKANGNPDEDPYAEAVKQGVNYLVNGYSRNNASCPELQAVTIAPVNRGGGLIDDPEAGQASPNGLGIQVYGCGGHIPYQSGQIMDAIISSGVLPTDLTGRDFAPGTAQSHNWTYGEVLQDMSDMHAWGQSESTGCNGGICGSWWYNWNAGYPGDNSASQWGAIGMIPAQHSPWSVVVPQWVKDYNANWLAYSMGCTGPSIDVTSCGYSFFSYNNAGGCADNNCLATTTSGMVQMIFDGQTTNDRKWGIGEKYVSDRWQSLLHTNTAWGGSRTYGWYSLAKAMRLSLPNQTTNLTKTSGATFDWYYGNPALAACTSESDCEKGLAPRILETQSANGSWQNGGMTEPPLTTAWMIITLNPTLFAASPSACFSAAPNPSYADQDITFDPSCSGHSETGKSIANLTKFEWDWNNDGVYDQSTATPTTLTHQFACAALPCTYPVKLRVTDDGNPALTATAVVNINITNPPHPPFAIAGGPYVASTCVGDTLTLDGSKSFDQDEGTHEAGCLSCPNDTITAWDWDLAAPLNFDAINKSGVTTTLTAADIALYFIPGIHNIGLRVTDNTALAYPGSEQTNLTHAAFGSVDVKSPCLCTITARAKTGMVQLNWAAAEHSPSTQYDIYRSTTGPNSGFTKIRSGYTNTYPLFVNTGLTNGTTYWYRVEKSLAPTAAGFCGSRAVSGRPMALR